MCLRPSTLPPLNRYHYLNVLVYARSSIAVRANGQHGLDLAGGYRHRRAGITVGRRPSRAPISARGRLATWSRPTSFTLATTRCASAPNAPIWKPRSTPAANAHARAGQHLLDANGERRCRRSRWIYASLQPARTAAQSPGTGVGAISQRPVCAAEHRQHGWRSTRATRVGVYDTIHWANASTFPPPAAPSPLSFQSGPTTRYFNRGDRV